jgi:hypothetical protein
MANLSVTDRVAVEQQEALFIRLVKAEAMAHMAMSDDFLDYEPSLIHAYLWGLSDMISEAKGLSEKSLNALLIDKCTGAEV